MNGKKAKALRQLAGGTVPAMYAVDKSTVRGRFMNTSLVLEADGRPKLDDEGNAVFNRVTWQTRTLMVAGGPRAVLKVLKNVYHNRTRDLHVNVHTGPIGATSAAA